MFIVRNKAEVIRFGFFLILAAAALYYVGSKVDAFRASEATAPTTPAVVAPRTTAPSPVAPGPGASSPALGGLKQPVQPDTFAELRMQRERDRGALTERLKEVMENQSVDAGVRAQASQQYLDAGRVASVEDRAEELVRAKGFEDAFVSMTGGSVTVVVKAASLSQQQSLQVIDTVARAADVKPQAVTVSYKAK